MTKSNDAPGQGQEQRNALDGLYTALRRPGIVRQSNGRWFAGVANGIARWLGVDPLVVRAGFILFSIFFGMGFALYLVLWLLMPDERGEIHLERALKHGEGSSIFLLVVTAVSVLGGGPWWGGDSRGFRFFGFVLLVVGAWWFLKRTDTGRELMAAAPWRSRAGGPTGPSTGPSTGAPSGVDPVTGAPFPSPAAAPTASTTAPSPAYGSTGNAAANAGATLAAPHPPAPTPVRERTPTIGFAGGLLLLGLAIVTGVVLSSVALAAGWPGNHVAIGIASGLGVLGLGILVAGIAGRRTGGLALFAVVGMIAAAASTAAPMGLSQPWQAGDRSYTVTSMTPAPAYELGLGQMTVDLSSANWKATPGQDTVTATVGVGELDLVVPDGVSVVVNGRARAGEILATGPTVAGEGMRRVGPDELQHQGTGWTQRVTFGDPTKTPEIVVNADLGVGQIKITTAPTS
ncbi:PspC domain-containing protein [Terrabacter aerolatus]|uniref:PspC family transcriptional regulator n=1 Tax=Terrabacter aerolatus TaxID=422442 RepID=A0A512D0N8_9MICO|nr:PspC domain-containing protein [Terrabacter aerolatus]GEO29830.1 PspC family transcriptional regulator [Terrabacter aerolatus]